MKKIFALAALIIATPAHGASIEQAEEYIKVCKTVSKLDLKGDALSEYLRKRWETHDEIMENIVTCFTYTRGKIDAFREIQGK